MVGSSCRNEPAAALRGLAKGLGAGFLGLARVQRVEILRALMYTSPRISSSIGRIRRGFQGMSPMVQSVAR